MIAAILRISILVGFVSTALGQADYKRFFDEENVPQVRRLLEAGRYDLAEKYCEAAFERNQPSSAWRVIYFTALAAQGRYEEAISSALQVLSSHPKDIPALMEAHDLLIQYGRTEDAGKFLTRINDVAVEQEANDRTPLETVALGRAALALGADPGDVLGSYFDPIKRQKPKSKDDVPEGLVEAFAAAGNLALDKSDYKRAAEEFRGALEFAPNDPDLRFGLARAFQPSDSEKTEQAIVRALSVNPLHLPSLFVRAEQAINGERYSEAEELIQRCLSVNPIAPVAHALDAVVANLARNDLSQMEASRAKGLIGWEQNPEVDHTIGRVLSRNYRFEEGARFQARALEMDSDYLDAKLQLAHDNLRLGREEKAWQLAAEVSEADPFDVLSYNLLLLEKEIASFETIETADFTIRLPAEEAAVYGERAMEILTESKAQLCEKYGLVLDQPVLVEFFPSRQDFAIRTFGNLGGQGILGACFGTVVTMNSPGGIAAGKNNWEATLWHEFCHVVTLTVTKNKMPRWLSEGISVYEETLRDPTWGQRMTGDSRRMILEDEALTPIEVFSTAFTNPESGEALMFAYYQAYLVVEYLIETYGIDNFRSILTDLADGVLINDAIAKHTAPLDELEPAFVAHVVELAQDLAPNADWNVPGPDEVNARNPLSVASFLKKNPTNLWALKSHATFLLEQQKWDEAVQKAKTLIEIFPEDTGANNGYLISAQAYRAQEMLDQEAEALSQLASRSGEAATAYLRLLELGLKSEDWSALKTNAHRAAAIDPFSRQIHYCLGCSHEATGERSEAIDSFERLLELGAANPSEIRYRLAKLIKPEDRERAKRYLLDSLADSPRYRDAHALLLDFE